MESEKGEGEESVLDGIWVVVGVNGKKYLGRTFLPRDELRDMHCNGVLQLKPAFDFISEVQMGMDPRTGQQTIGKVNMASLVGAFLEPVLMKVRLGPGTTLIVINDASKSDQEMYKTLIEQAMNHAKEALEERRKKMLAHHSGIHLPSSKHGFDPGRS